MAQSDQLQQVNAQVPASQTLARAGERERSNLSSRSSAFGLVWRYRAFVAGTLSIALALAAEILMRPSAPVPGEPTLPGWAACLWLWPCCWWASSPG